jgi:hypothetical protein
METAGKLILVAAALLALIGGGLLLASKLGIGRLPGDIVVRRGNFTLYAPLGLMIVVSVVLTLVLNVILRR